jgi:hypothetical protein
MNTKINLGGSKTEMQGAMLHGIEENLLVELRMVQGRPKVMVFVCDDEDEELLGHRASIRRLKAEGYTHLMAHPLKRAFRLK